MTAANPYGRSRIVRGMKSLVVGKAVTSVAGIGTFLLLVRVLPVEQFAVYSVLFALVNLADALSGVGLAHVLSRYVPELFAAHRHTALRHFVRSILSLRLCALGLFVAVVALSSTWIAPMIGLGGWEWAFQAYMLVTLFRVGALTLFSVLESMLHQTVAQIGFSVTTLARFLLLAGFAMNGQLDLGTVIAIEIATDLGCFLFLLAGTILKMPRDQGLHGKDEKRWTRANLDRLVAFGTKGYLQQLLILPYGSSVNRLLVGSTLPGPAVALYGFGQSVADLIERYLPLKLFGGVIRPVLTAQYAASGDFSRLSSLANLIFKLNALLVCAAATVLLAGGADLVVLVTAGKYADGGVPLLALMLALIGLFSLRHVLDHVAHAVERNGPLAWSNAVITLSVVPGIALLPALGVFALPLANLAGIVAGICVLVNRLRAAGHDLRLDVRGILGLFAATAAGYGIALAAEALHAHWALRVVTALAGFAGGLLLFRSFSAEERRLLGALVKRR